MTFKEVYAYALVEVNKVAAPAVLREDFIYLSNKAITDYVNERYNIYEETQQLTDDLRVLTRDVIIEKADLTKKVKSVFKATYVGHLPQDYLHILNCSVEFVEGPNYKAKCKLSDSDRMKGVKKMTSQMYSGLINNYYLKPSTKNPFFYLKNINEVVPPATSSREPEDRIGNPQPVNIELIYGNDDTKLEINNVFIDYLRVPKYMYITEEELESDDDTSQSMEFPYYACLEIIKRLVALLLENASDSRLQTNIPINQTIGGPARQQAGGRSR